MKTLDPALQAHLDEGTTTLAWCWRIARADALRIDVPVVGGHINMEALGD